jgi:K+-sensing histidine kinase KdpD
MNQSWRRRDVIALAAALVLPLGIVAILVPFRSSFANTASALVLVAAIVAVAVTGSRFTGLVATVSATLWFDLFLTRPYGRLAISHRPDIETAVSLFVVGVIVTELAARNRHHYEAAAEESDYVALIYGLSELVASGAPAQKVIERGRTELIDVLNLRDCRYEPQLSERRVARLDHDGEVIHVGVVWGAHNMGLPGPAVDLLVQARGQVLGRFVLRPTPGYPVSLHRRVVAVAIADQVGAALSPQLRSA